MAASLCGSIFLATASALAMPPAAKQYLPVIPTANGPAAVRGSGPVARPDQLSRSARTALKGKSGAQLRSVATATALGAPAHIDRGYRARVAGARPGFLSAAFDAVGQGAVLALLAGFAIVTGLLVYLARPGRRRGAGTRAS